MESSQPDARRVEGPSSVKTAGRNIYLSRFTKAVIIPQNILGVAALAAPFFAPVSAWWLLVRYFGWVILGVFGVSTVFHKYYAHRAFEIKPGLRFLLPAFNYLGMLTGQGSALAYAAVHRGYHHRYADKDPLDPHSPKIHSFWHSYYGWHFKRMSVGLKSVSDLKNDRFLVWTHRNYNTIYLVSLFVVGLFSWRLMLYGIVIPGLIHVHEMNVLNSFSHKRWFGYRNFDVDDDSVNNWIFGILSWGTGFHNNHHASPGAWHNQIKWYEFDPFRWILPPLILARSTSLPPAIFTKPSQVPLPKQDGI
jgi:stearoyl-CoA desaturase (delta-9 desaturase)